MDSPFPTIVFPELRGGIPYEGKISAFPAYALLWHAAQHKVSGVLTFERDQRIKEVMLERGELRHISSNLVPEGLEMLLHRGFLEASTIAQLSAEKNEEHLLKRLSSEHLLDSSQLKLLTGLQREEQLLNLLGWFEGSFRLIEKTEKWKAPGPLQDAYSLVDFFRRLSGVLSGDSAQAHEFICVKDMPPPQGGELRPRGGAATVLAFTECAATGTLLFERGQRRKLFHWKNGQVSSIASTDPSETLAVTLHRWGYLRTDLVTRLEGMARKRELRLRDAIRQEGLLSDEEIARALLTLHLERILETFSWRSGSYQFRGEISKQKSPAITPTMDPSPVDPPTQTNPFESIRSLMGPPPNNAVLFATFEGQGDLLDPLESVVNPWTDAGKKTVIVKVGASRREDHQASEWKNGDEWRGLVKALPRSHGDFLPIAAEDRTWRSAEGITRLRGLILGLAQAYDYVLWISPAPQKGSPLFSFIPHVVFVLTEGRSSVEELGKALEEARQTQIDGFLWVPSSDTNTFATIKSAIRAIPLRWHRRS